MSVAALDSHPVPTCVRGFHALLDATPTAAWDGLEVGEVRRLVAEIGRAEARLSAHKMAAARVLDKARKANNAASC